MNKEEKENQINIELPEEISEGIYSNLSVITHSNTEFVMDFIQMMPGVPKAKVKSRIIMTPQNTKRLLKALSDNINKFEMHNGVINDTEPNKNFPLSFGGPTTEA